jgi:hypothetical protein
MDGAGWLAAREWSCGMEQQAPAMAAGRRRRPGGDDSLQARACMTIESCVRSSRQLVMREICVRGTGSGSASTVPCSVGGHCASTPRRAHSVRVGAWTSVPFFFPARPSVLLHRDAFVASSERVGRATCVGLSKYSYGA